MDDQYAKILDHQADLTARLRSHIFRKIGLPRLKSVLDVGCGTGKISAEIAQRNVAVIGVDIDPDAIALARRRFPEIDFQHVTGGRLPFKDASFDLAFCHFVLMWQADPVALVREMARVTRPGGWVVAAAEPDWGARISFPDDGLTAPMIEALRKEDADPYAGRALRSHFARAGLKCELGVWPSAVQAPCDQQTFEAEWAFYAYMLRNHPALPLLAQAKSQAQKANERGDRLVFIPIFYTLARKQ